MTLAEIESEVRVHIRDVEKAKWTDAEVLASINDGYMDISDYAEWNEKSIPIDIKDQNYYDLSELCDDQFLAPRAIFNVQTNWWLEYTDPRDLDILTYWRWETVNGQPLKQSYRGLWWLSMFPKTTTGTVTLNWVGLPDPLSDPTDVPGFPAEFHWGLVEYACYDLQSMIGETDKALSHWVDYANEKEPLGFRERLRRYVNDRIRADRIYRMGG